MDQASPHPTVTGAEHHELLLQSLKGDHQKVQSLGTWWFVGPGIAESGNAWKCWFSNSFGDREPARAMMMLFLGEFPCMQVTWEWGCWDEVVEVVEMSKKWAVWRPNAWCYLSYVTRHVVYYSSYWSATRSTMLSPCYSRLTIFTFWYARCVSQGFDQHPNVSILNQRPLLNWSTLHRLWILSKTYFQLQNTAFQRSKPISLQKN